MKKLFLVTAFSVISAVSASAADLYVKARPMVSPAWDWSGFYAGVNVGAGIPRTPADTTITDPTLTPPTVFSDRTTIDKVGVIGGGQIGYNRVVSPWLLLGVEVDIQGAGLNATNRTLLPGPLAAGSFIDVGTRLNWFGTARLRAGWLVTPETMIYATGGLAFGEVKLNTASFEALSGVTTVASASDTKAGWTVGGGIETRLWNSNWTAKAEYLYVDLGKLSVSAPYGVGGFIQNTSADFHEHIARAGVNYKFGAY